MTSLSNDRVVKEKTEVMPSSPHDRQTVVKERDDKGQTIYKYSGAIWTIDTFDESLKEFFERHWGNLQGTVDLMFQAGSDDPFPFLFETSLEVIKNHMERVISLIEENTGEIQLRLTGNQQMGLVSPNQVLDISFTPKETAKE